MCADYLRTIGRNIWYGRAIEEEHAEADLDSTEYKFPIEQKADYLYEFYNPAIGDPNVDIIFFHGLSFSDSLNPNPYLSTWVSSTDPPVLWPQTWLPEEFPSARIFGIQYDCSSKTVPTTDIFLVAESLLHTIMDKSFYDTGKQPTNNRLRPLVLVGHSLGGLLIKKVLYLACQWQVEDDSSERSRRSLQAGDFLRRVELIFFYATPHQGIPCFEELVKRSDSPLFRDHARTLNRELARLNEAFERYRKQFEIKTVGVGESHFTDLAYLDLPPTLVVPESSARGHLDDFVMVPEDHMSIAQPRSKKALCYLFLVGHIQDALDRQAKSSIRRIHSRGTKYSVRVGDQLPLRHANWKQVDKLLADKRRLAFESGENLGPGRLLVSRYPGAVEALIVMLSDDQDEERQKLAVWTLAEITFDRANKVGPCRTLGLLEGLANLLDPERDVDVREGAACALAQLAWDAENGVAIVNQRGVLPGLVRMLMEDRHPKLQYWSAYALADLLSSASQNSFEFITFEGALKGLVHLLHKVGRPGHCNVVVRASWALDRAAAVEKVRNFMASFPGAVQALTAKLTEDDNLSVQKSAALTLARLACDTDSQPTICRIALRALVHASSREPRQDENRGHVREVRSRAIETLARLTSSQGNRVLIAMDRKASEVLVILLTNTSTEDVELRCWAAFAINELSREKSVRWEMWQWPHFLEGVLQVLRYKSQNAKGVKARQYAASTLRNLSQEDRIKTQLCDCAGALETIVNLLAEANQPEIQKYATSTLENLASAKENRMKICVFPQFLWRLIELLGEEVEDGDRTRAASTLASLIEEEACKLYYQRILNHLRFLSGDEDEVKRSLSKTVERLEQLLEAAR